MCLPQLCAPYRSARLRGVRAAPAETKEYTVTFDSAGGTAVQSVTVQEGATLKAPEAPVKATFSARYDFTGWYYEGRLWVFDADVVDGDITLTANWELAEEYTNVYPPKS